MKADTIVWAKFESKGRPKHTEIHQLPIRQIVVRLADWLLRVYMGSHIVVTLARTEAELVASSRGQGVAGDADLIAELESLMKQEHLDLEGDESPELFSQEN